MAILDNEANPDLDISTLVEVLSYENTTGRTLLVMCAVMIGTPSSEIAGNGDYVLRAYIDDAEIMPPSSVAVTSQTFINMQSRQVSLQVGQTITVMALGLEDDIAVDVTAVLIDVTPLTINDLLGGGSIPVDHNYGGEGELLVVDPDDVGIDDVQISAYLTSDYDDGNRTAEYVRGRTTTNMLGEWVSPISLDPGEYTLVLMKSGEFVTRTIELTVE